MAVRRLKDCFTDDHPHFVGVRETVGLLNRNMEKYFERYEQMPQLRIATLLDPRYKNRYFNVPASSRLHFMNIKDDIIEASQSLQDMSLEFVNTGNSGSDSDIDDPGADPAAIGGAMGTAEDSIPFRGFDYNDQNPFNFFEYSDTRFPIQPQESLPLPTQELTIHQEFNRYMTIPINPEADHLQWWRERRRDFPMLSAVANRHLSAPPSSVESERTFSIGGRVYSPHRAGRLSAANGERFMVLNQNLRHFNYQYDDDDE